MAPTPVAPGIPNRQSSRGRKRTVMLRVTPADIADLDSVAGQWGVTRATAAWLLVRRALAPMREDRAERLLRELGDPPPLPLELPK